MTARRLSPAETSGALRACLRERDRSTPDPVLVAALRGRDVTPLVAAATRHRVLTSLHLAVAGTDAVPPGVATGLRRHYDETVARHLRTLAELAGLQTLLDGAGVPWLTFKGPLLAELAYPRPDLRRYDDLDLLVPRLAFGAVVELLERGGHLLLDRNWDLITSEQRGQLHFRLRYGTPADVHWHLVTRLGTRSTLAVPMDELLERARPVRVGGTPVSTFDPVDGLIHLCVHAGLGGGDVLLLLKDVERWGATQHPDWSGVVRQARRWRAPLLVGAVLTRARDSVGAAVPGAVLRDLCGGAAGRVVRSLAAGWPAERPEGVPAAVAFSTRSLRSGLAGSVHTAATDARQQRRLRTVQRRAERAAPRLAVLRPSTRVASREEYLATVGSAAAGRPGARYP